MPSLYISKNLCMFPDDIAVHKLISIFQTKKYFLLIPNNNITFNQ